jgi:hypothetical protein
MSDDLVKRLRDDSGDWLTDLAVDRIEELKGKLKWADEISNIQADRIEELEAKAMKAANAALLEKRRADAAEARVKELDAEIAKWRAAFIAQSRKLQGEPS